MIPDRNHRGLVIIFLLEFLLTACSGGFSDGEQLQAGAASCDGVSIGNPSAAYCSMLGYKYFTVFSADGISSMSGTSTGWYSLPEIWSNSQLTSD